MIVAGILQDGSSNWLEGAMLMATYTLCAIMFYMTPDSPDPIPSKARSSL